MGHKCGGKSRPRSNNLKIWWRGIWCVTHLWLFTSLPNHLSISPYFHLVIVSEWWFTALQENHAYILNSLDFFFSRKEQLSSKFRRRYLLSRYLRAWHQWVKNEQEERQLREEHNRKTQKMAALLEAAATGRLWSEQGGRTGMSLELQDIEDDVAEQSSSTARKVVRVVCDVIG